MPMTNMFQHLHPLIRTQHQIVHFLTSIYGRRLVLLACNQQEGCLDGGVVNIGRVGDGQAERNIGLGVLVQEGFANEGLGEIGGTGAGGCIGDCTGH